MANNNVVYEEVHFSNDCPCIDSKSIMKEISDCKTPSGNPGLTLKNGITCYPLDYGNARCDLHDVRVDALCQADDPDDIPDYCKEHWCYVDLAKCRLSTELLFNSDLFPGTELYYSYSTCNSSSAAWSDFSTTAAFRSKTHLRATVPGSLYPTIYKLDHNNSIASFSGPEYYDSNNPFEGSLVDYMSQIIGVSDEIDGINYVIRSKGSDIMHPVSSFTASVRDVQVGLSDLGVGSFWVTAERLEMTSFTTPIFIDKTFLAVKRPAIDNSFQYQIEKVLQPFSNELWYLLLVTLVIVSSLSIWFASPKQTNKRPWLAFRNEEWRNGGITKRTWILWRQVLEAFLEKGMYVTGAAVEQDFRASLPHKLLMMGFSFLIIVAVSAYVANLAAFLTLSGVSEYIHNMELAIATNTYICAHPVLRNELESLWPKANFVYNDETPEYLGVIENYDAGKCTAIAASIIDTRYDTTILEKFCERDLVYTNGVVIEVPVAFPVREDLAAGVSHLLTTGDKLHGISFSFLNSNYEPTISCSVELHAELSNADDLEPLTPQYMVFPFFLLGMFAIAAIFVKLCNKNNTEYAAQFIARTARLNKRRETALLNVARFAHLDAKYDISKRILKTYDGDDDLSIPESKFDPPQPRNVNTFRLSRHNAPTPEIAFNGTSKTYEFDSGPLDIGDSARSGNKTDDCETAVMGGSSSLLKSSSFSKIPLEAENFKSMLKDAVRESLLEMSEPVLDSEYGETLPETTSFKRHRKRGKSNQVAEDVQTNNDAEVGNRRVSIKDN